MKIIQHGQPKTTVRRFRCTKCGCVFEAEKGEYKVFFDRNEHYHQCNCPECAGIGNEINEWGFDLL